MNTRLPFFLRQLLSHAPGRALPAAFATLSLLLAGCSATMSPPPPVDISLPTTPMPPVQVSRAAPPVTGGIYYAGSYRPSFEDRRARMVGDMVTVQISENVTASQTSSSTVDRKSAADAGITALPFLPAGALNRASLGGSANNTFAGKGGTESANTFTGSITATVVDVLPNGHLVITGEKQIGVNHNVDVLRFSGTVDPRAMQPGSIVNSTQVANVRVESRGRGAQNEAQAMGWLSRAFTTVSPF